MQEPSHYVAFVDVLGFAQQVDALDSAGFKAICDYWGQRVLPQFDSPAYHLVQTYETFQQLFGEYQSYAALDGSRRKTPAIVDAFLFSDSGFVATTDPQDLLNFCRSLIRALMYSHVPIRAGIGAGTFASFDIETRRATGGHFFARCPFVGSAVVRAYRAESCGLRGLRCFVHPSFAEAAPPEALEQLVALDEHDRCASASHEVDLFWSLLGVHPDEVNECVKSLREMQGAAPLDKSQHYEDTYAAFGRMLKRHGSDRPAG